MERTICGMAVDTQTKLSTLLSILHHACREWKVPVPALRREKTPYVYGSTDDTSICLNPEYGGLNTATLLHELAHWIHEKRGYACAEHHGPAWAGIYAKLLDRYNVLPIEAFEAMAKRWQVEWTYCGSE
jgi:hypothetical protein